MNFFKYMPRYGMQFTLDLNYFVNKSNELIITLESLTLLTCRERKLTIAVSDSVYYML